MLSFVVSLTISTIGMAIFLLSVQYTSSDDYAPYMTWRWRLSFLLIFVGLVLAYSGVTFNPESLWVGKLVTSPRNFILVKVSAVSAYGIIYAGYLLHLAYRERSWKPSKNKETI